MALPMMNFPILTQQQANPFFSGAQQGTDLVNSLMKNYALAQQNKVLPQSLAEALQQQQYKTQIMAPQAQYAPQMTLADLAKTQSGTQLDIANAKESMARIPYYGAQSQELLSRIPLNKADASLKEFQVNNPLLSLTGPASQIGAIEYLRQHPELNTVNGGGMPPSGQQNSPGNVSASDLLNQNQQAGPGQVSFTSPYSQPTTPNAGNLSGGTYADMLGNMITNKQNADAARSAYYNKRVEATNYSSLPIDQKSGLLAQASGMGYDPQDATNLFMQGHSLQDLAKAKGFDPESMPDPIYPVTKGGLAKIQTRQQALAEINNLNPILTDALAPYSHRIFGYSPKQVSQALSGTDPDQQAKFLAAKALQPELSSIRLRAMQGGQVGIEAIREVTNASMGNIKSYQSLVDPKVYASANQYVDQWINQATNAANKVNLNAYSQMNQASPTSQPSLPSTSVAATPSTNTPDYNKWIIAAKAEPGNKGYSDLELRDYYNKKYGGGK
jgi:hypothetical protein